MLQANFRSSLELRLHAGFVRCVCYLFVLKLCVFPFVFVLESLVLLDSRFFLIRSFALKLCSGRTLLAAYGLQAASQKPLRLHRKGARPEGCLSAGLARLGSRG